MLEGDNAVEEEIYQAEGDRRFAVPNVVREGNSLAVQ